MRQRVLRLGPASARGCGARWVGIVLATATAIVALAGVDGAAAAGAARHRPPRSRGCVARGASYVSRGPAAPRVVALTFDDGPWYDTPRLLRILERAHVRATFFQIGRQIARYGGVDGRMLADGDVIGDHTWDHRDIAYSGATARSEISSTAAAIRRATGYRVCLFRAPYGAVSRRLIAEARGLGMLTIGWDVDPRDWARPGTEWIYRNVIDNAHPGAIILQHDGGGNRSQTLAAVPREIAWLRARGYGFVTVPQLLRLRELARL